MPLSTQESALAISGLQNRQNDLLPLKDPNNTFKSRHWANPAKTNLHPQNNLTNHPQRLSTNHYHHPLTEQEGPIPPGLLPACSNICPLSHADQRKRITSRMEGESANNIISRSTQSPSHRWADPIPRQPGNHLCSWLHSLWPSPAPAP